MTEQSFVMLCRYCGKVYKSRSGLSDHERQHTKEAPFHCCGKLFFSHSHIIRHRCNVHKTEERCFGCDQGGCDASFGTQSELRMHKKRVHEERQYKCDTCGQTFSNKSALTDHIDLHMGVKRHQCQCGKAYRYSSGLSKHKIICNKKVDSTSS